MTEDQAREPGPAREPGAGRDPAPAVTRSLRILTLLAESGGRAQTLSDIARTLDLAKSSTANLCLALEEGDMIQRTAEGYRLGRRTAELGGAYALRFNQVREFFDVCAASPELAGEVVQIAMLDGTDVLYLARHEGRAPYSLGTPIGSRLPAALSATGAAILATMAEAEVRDLLAEVQVQAVTETGPRSRAELLARIADVRRRGYAVDREESFAGVTGVAVALPPGAPSDPLLAMGAALPADTGEADVGRIAAALTEAARQLTNPLAVQS
ncbi:IclR family transcriptional regulator [Ruania zhangjianzhongii]|uniref:IclR family transcriptional regulator n=1 Tax=Ruania zhangjianzhongii TaxID=2603206 RepID=UPI0011C84E1A|nr:IclR family transcriptional regulator [Ruania zhangjianzhongii]